MTKSIQKIIATALLPILLFCGCSQNAQTDSTGTSAPEEPAGTTSEIYLYDIPKINDYRDEFGEVIDFKNSYFDATGMYYKLEGYTHLAFSENKSKNSIENPELFTDDEDPEAPSPEKSDYFRAKIGDSFGELTLRQASVAYNPAKATDYMEAGNYLMYSVAEFDGEITVTGYITANITNDQEYTEDGEITFIPDGSAWEKYPVPYHKGGIRYMKNNDRFVSSAPIISLGTLNDYNIDLSAIPDDGSFAKVTVTMKDLCFIYRDTTMGACKNIAIITAVSA